MVEKIVKLIKKVKIEKGDLVLFMLWKDVSEVEKWTVIISADWIDTMGQNLALNYWVAALRGVLSTNELESISRISFLKVHDNFVRSFVQVLNISSGAVYFKQNQVGNYFINEAIVFEAKRIFKTPRNSTYQRNPVFNSTLNPNLNSAINPNLNSAINPNLNSAINPNLNSAFNGSFLYDLKLNKVAFLVDAPQNVLLMFDFDNKFIGFCVKANQQFYVVFDTSNKWTGYLVFNKQKGFNYFSTNTQWSGFVV